MVRAIAFTFHDLVWVAVIAQEATALKALAAVLADQAVSAWQLPATAFAFVEDATVAAGGTFATIPAPHSSFVGLLPVGHAFREHLFATLVTSIVFGFGCHLCVCSQKELLDQTPATHDIHSVDRSTRQTRSTAGLG